MGSVYRSCNFEYVCDITNDAIEFLIPLPTVKNPRALKSLVNSLTSEGNIPNWPIYLEAKFLISHCIRSL